MASPRTSPGRPAEHPAAFVAIGPSHAEGLVRLFERNVDAERAGLFNPFPLNAGTAQEIACGKRRDLYFGLASGEELIGMTMLRGWDEGYEIPSFGILIDREHQGRGLGRTMTEATLEQARRAGCRTVRLSVYASNAVAHRMYKRVGFSEIERQPVRVANRDDERIVMVCGLGELA
jgi:ribosomal protein S18 acetylase RimI-like enzyme